MPRVWPHAIVVYACSSRLRHTSEIVNEKTQSFCGRSRPRVGFGSPLNRIKRKRPRKRRLDPALHATPIVMLVLF